MSNLPLGSDPHHDDSTIHQATRRNFLKTSAAAAASIALLMASRFSVLPSPLAPKAVTSNAAAWSEDAAAKAIAQSVMVLCIG